jgi:uncharacterized coiled-coil protein SlyX
MNRFSTAWLQDRLQLDNIRKALTGGRKRKEGFLDCLDRIEELNDELAFSLDTINELRSRIEDKVSYFDDSIKMLREMLRTQQSKKK